MVRTTVSPGVGSLPFHIAQERGFFEDRGLRIKTTEGYDIPTYLAAIDRQFDVVMQVSSTTVQAAGSGRVTQGFAGMEALTEDILTNPVITKDPSVRSIADLAGKKVGVAAVGGVSDAVFETALKPTGTSVEDVNFVAVPFPNMLDQLRAGRIDAINSAVGFFEPLLDEGYRIVAKLPQQALAQTGAKFPISYAHFTSSPKYAESNPETLLNFRTAIEDAVKWIDANPDAALASFAEWTGRDPSTVKTIKMPKWKTVMDADDYSPWLPIMEEAGLLRREVDPQSLVADVPEAAQ